MSLPVHSPPRFLAQALTLLLLAMLAHSALRAQQPPLPPLENVYGVGDDEFFIGGWGAPAPDSAEVQSPANTRQHVKQIWDFAKWYGVNILRIETHQGYDPVLGRPDDFIDSLVNTADTTQRLIIGNGGPELYAPAHGRELQFSLIPDSVQFNSYPCKFTSLVGGITDTTGLPLTQLDDFRQPALERVYMRADHQASLPNLEIASGIVFDWDPGQIYRWPRYLEGGVWHDRPSDSTQKRAYFFGPTMSHDRGADTHYVVVTGHLLEDGGTALPTDSILRIDITYDIADGEQFYSNGGIALVANSGNRSVPCTTLFVQKSQLAPVGNDPWEKYQEIALPFDAGRCSGDTAGPHGGYWANGEFHADARSPRFDIRLTWIGNEDVALRSIAIRDSIGELMLSAHGKDTAIPREAVALARRYAHAAAAGTPRRGRSR